MTKLDYISGDTIIPKGHFKISPSSFAKFFSKPHLWYREEVLGEEGFTGSEASYLGTVIHYIAEEYVKSKGTCVDKYEIYRYLFQELCSNQSLSLPSWSNGDHEDEIIDFLLEHCDHPEIRVSVILEHYKPMGNALIELLRTRPFPDMVEPMVAAEVIPGYWAAGSIDSYNSSTGEINDYKTSSDLTPKKSIPYDYKLQLLTYAWILKQKGYNPTKMSITWITRNNVNRVNDKGNPLKDYPSVATKISEVITNDDFEFIESLLKLCAESVQYGKANPDSVPYIFRDYRLKPKTKTEPILFN